jgi:hypothetical protein
LQSGHEERSAGVAALESRIRELEADTSQLDTLRHTAQLFTQLQVRHREGLESHIRELEADTSQLDTLRHTAQLLTQLQVRTSGGGGLECCIREL